MSPLRFFMYTTPPPAAPRMHRGLARARRGGLRARTTRSACWRTWHAATAPACQCRSGQSRPPGPGAAQGRRGRVGAGSASARPLLLHAPAGLRRGGGPRADSFPRPTRESSPAQRRGSRPRTAQDQGCRTRGARRVTKIQTLSARGCGCASETCATAWCASRGCSTRSETASGLHNKYVRVPDTRGVTLIRPTHSGAGRPCDPWERNTQASSVACAGARRPPRRQHAHLLRSCGPSYRRQTCEASCTAPTGSAFCRIVS